MKSSSMIPCEYGPIGLGAFSVTMAFLMGSSVGAAPGTAGRPDSVSRSAGAAARTGRSPARARAGTHDRVSAIDVWQRFAAHVERVDEHAVGAQVCGEREAVGGIGKNAVGMRRCLTLRIRPCSRVMNHLPGWRECTIRLNR